MYELLGTKELVACVNRYFTEIAHKAASLVICCMFGGWCFTIIRIVAFSDKEKTARRFLIFIQKNNK